jgi:hypothetical protein
MSDLAFYIVAAYDPVGGMTCCVEFTTSIENAAHLGAFKLGVVGDIPGTTTKVYVAPLSVFETVEVERLPDGPDI